MQSCGSVMETPGFPYSLLEIIFDLSQSPTVTSDNTALELYQRTADGLELLETVPQ